MELTHHLDAVADSKADLLENFEPLLHLGRADELTTSHRRGRVEWPDLHCGVALVDQAVREFSGRLDEGYLVVVLPADARGALLDQAPLHLLCVVVDTGAGVVRAHFVVATTAEKLVDRLSRRMTEHVPQGDIDCRSSARLDTAAVESEVAPQQDALQPTDLQRILADKQRCGHRVDI